MRNGRGCLTLLPFAPGPTEISWRGTTQAGARSPGPHGTAVTRLGHLPYFPPAPPGAASRFAAASNSSPGYHAGRCARFATSRPTR